MAVHQKSNAAENLTGKGWVFKGKKSFVEVLYELEVFENILVDAVPVKQIVTGKIRAANKVDKNILWGTGKLTLRLQDKRRLDFFCVNFDPECDITSDTGFYF
jgi:hypothetical protein